MEIKLIICFSCVIPTINFQWLKILLVTLLFFIVEYIFLKQFVKLLMVKYTYLLITYSSKYLQQQCLFCSTFIEKRSCCLFWYTMSYKKIEKSDYMQLQVTTSTYELESGWQKGSAGDCELQLVMAGQNMSDYKWLWVTITNGCHT